MLLDCLLIINAGRISGDWSQSTESKNTIEKTRHFELAERKTVVVKCKIFCNSFGPERTKMRRKSNEIWFSMTLARCLDLTFGVHQGSCYLPLHKCKASYFPPDK